MNPINSKIMIGTLGTLVKLEYLKTVDSYIMPNSFVLQNLEPFPSYHGKNLPIDQGPDSFFLVTTEANSPEKIFRIAHNIRQSTHQKFDACPANIHFGNDCYQAIRIRDLESYKPVEKIQLLFAEAGIHFQKKKNLDSQALIELRKIFVLEQVTEEIYKDKNGILHYINIHKQLDWDNFISVTNWVKNNIDDNNFDAALVVIYGKDVYDLIRIFTHDMTINRLEDIRKKYLEGIGKSE